MGRVSAEIRAAASLAEVWETYLEPRTWPAWVDGFRAVEASVGYPDAGGTLQWRSVPNGRGTVSETVIGHEPRRLHRIRYQDPESEGELLTTFAIEGDGTRVRQELKYRLRKAGLLGPLTDRLFVRSQMRMSLARSLSRLRAEVESAATEG